MAGSNGTGINEREKNEQPARILIADDSDDFRNMLMRRVERMGHSVVGAADGIQAIQAIKKDRFDLLVVDLIMPGKNGLEVIKIAQHIDPSTQVIVVTGQGSVESAIEALRYRVFDFLTKPLNFLRFFEITVQQALDQAFRVRKKNNMIVEFQRMALIDPLTGLYNHYKLHEELEREIQRSKSLGQPFSLIMLDLDDLKSINSSYGNAFGDEVLCRIADVIQSEPRKIDIPVRYGGDDFLIVLPGTRAKNAMVVAERFVESISGLDIHGIPISVSIGIAEWKDSFQTDEDIINAVDKALNQSKVNAESCITVG